jgi:hypothetical protein
MQRAAENPSYAHSVETFLERLNVDVWTVEMKDGDRAVVHSQRATSRRNAKGAHLDALDGPAS